MKKQPLYVLLPLIAVAVVAAIAVAIYLAGFIALPLLKVPVTAHYPTIFIDYWRSYPSLHKGPLGIAGMAGLALTCLPLLVLLAKPSRSLHGDARFATNLQVKEANLRAEKGIIVGQRGNDYLVFGGQQHVLMSAPSRSGKGVGIVIPNLLNWPDSVVVLDIKQENWDITAGYRAKYGQKCFLFNPAAEDRRTARYNPLDYISDDPHFRINDIQKIGQMLYPDLQTGVDPIWNASCRSLFVGIVLYLKETPALPCTLGEVLRSSLTTKETAEHFQDIIDEREEEGNPLSRECISALNDYIGVSSANTRSSIKKTFTSRMELWLNPVIDAATSHSDFNLRNVRREKTSIYVGITPDNLERLQPIINLLFQQLLDQNTRELPERNPDLKYSCLLLMDEFTAIGKIGVLAKGISYVAGYNLRMLPIIQSPAQVREVYGKDAAETFITNHALKIIFAPGEFHVAKEISDTLGNETVNAQSESKGKNPFVARRANISTSQQARALLLPQEVMRMGMDNCLLLVEAVRPIQAKKIKYYQDPTFTERLLDAPAVPLLKLDSLLATVRTPTPVQIAARAEAVAAADELNQATTPAAIPASAAQAQADDPFGEPVAVLERPQPAPQPTPKLNGSDVLPTTAAMTDLDDPFADPLDADSAPETPDLDTEDFSFDFEDVEIEAHGFSDEKLAALHRSFLVAVGAEGEA